MSGGTFDYIQYKLKDAAIDLEEAILNNDVENEYGYSRSYPKEILDVMREASLLSRKLSVMLHCIDYLMADDYGFDSFWYNLKERMTDDN